MDELFGDCPRLPRATPRRGTADAGEAIASTISTDSTVSTCTLGADSTVCTRTLRTLW